MVKIFLPEPWQDIRYLFGGIMILGLIGKGLLSILNKGEQK